MTKPDDKSIEQAISARDTATLSQLLEKGADANWKDAAGNTLMHHAARFGDLGLVALLQAKGASAFVFNAEGESPFDVAAVWGNDAVAKKISEGIEAEIKAAAEKPVIPYKTLQEIRDASAFYDLAKRGQFAQVTALAEKEGGFVASDLLQRGPDGDTAAHKLVQLGQLGLLLKPALWIAKPEDFQKVWESVPANYRSAHDYTGFVSDLRQAKLQSYAKPKLPGLKGGPKLGPTP